VRRHSDRRFGVLFLDLDRFKLVNGQPRPQRGGCPVDRASPAHAGVSSPQGPDRALGGDEFAILVEDLSADREVVMLAERLQEMLAEPLSLKGVPVSSSASIGITTSTLSYESHDQVMRDADIAMYRAKAQGKGRYAIFDKRPARRSDRTALARGRVAARRVAGAARSRLPARLRSRHAAA
jgi:diguanylate cyclase (GGDEF)-like protein